MRIPAYRPSEGTTAYVIGTTVADPRPLLTYLTVADVLREEAHYGRPEQSATTIDEIETIVIESDPEFHASIVDRLGRGGVHLIEADRLL